MQTVRVFVSSPGDAANERKRVVRVIEKLNAAFAGAVAMEPVLWEERFYSAHDGFQPQIARSADCDIVVAILRARLGTPLPCDFAERLPPDERIDACPSGTAYEILSAIAARRRGAELPEIFVFRYPLAPSVALDAPDRAETEAQWEKLKSFAERVFLTAEGLFKGAYQTFASTDDFETKVEGALRQWLEEHVLKGRAFVWPIAIKGSPFRGLEPFGAKHAEVFFGRDGDRARALDRLKDAAEAGFPFLLIVGPSGAGKSSFARAGVLPWIVKPGAVTGVGVWRATVMRPSNHPDGAIASLARHMFDAASDIPEMEAGRPLALPELAAGDSATPQALAALFSTFARGTFARADDLEAAGRAAVAPIQKALALVAETELKASGGGKEQPARLLLIVDQLDEMFGADLDDAARTAFARLLDGLARTGLVWIVATLRAELYDAFLKSPLARLASPDMHGNARRLELTFDLLPPGLTEVAEVVRGPARAAGLEWETDLVSKKRLDEHLLDDIDRPDLLPLVQFVLDRLYEQRAVKDGKVTLTFDAYRALGTLDGAIDLAAEKAVSALGPAERAALPRLLRALVAHGGDRGAVTLTQVPQSIAAHDAVSARLIDALVEARILISGQDQNQTPTVALAHQRVVEAWRSARKIVADSEGLLRNRDEVENARQRWELSGQRRDRLIAAGLPLSEAENAAMTLGDELPAATRTYVERSGRAARLRQRLTAAAALVFLAVAALAALQWNRASHAAQAAEDALDAARRDQSAALAALSNASLTASPVRAMKFALAAWPRSSKDRMPKLDVALNALSAAVANAFGQWRELRAFRGHDAEVTSAAFSPDGNRVVTASDDKTARLWDVATGKQLAVLRGHEDRVLAAAFSPDGARVVTASVDKTARLWDAATGGQIGVLRGHDAVVWRAAFSPDGARVATASADKTARLWDAATGAQVRVFRGHDDQIVGVAFSPDGARVATGSGDETARLWETATGKQVAILRGHEGWVNSVAFSPDGARVVTASADKTARLWDAASGKQAGVLRGHDQQVYSAAFSPDGARVVTASGDRTARLWDAAAGEQIAVLRGHDGRLFRAAFSPDGALVVTASEDGTALVWEAPVREQVAVLRGHDGWVFSAAFSPDGARVVTASTDKTARLWDAVAGKQVSTLLGHEQQVYSAAFSPDGARVVTASEDGTARLWDAAGKQVAVLRGHDDGVWSVAFSPDGARVVTASKDKTARLWDAVAGKQVAILRGHDDQVLGAAFSQDGARVVTASMDKTARLWDVATGKQVGILRGHDGWVLSAAFSPDGARVVTASEDKTARLWDVATGAQIGVLRGHEDQVLGAAFSPDGARVVTASMDDTARLWGADTGRQVAILRGHDNWLLNVSFAPDGARVVTASADKTARVWDVSAIPKGTLFEIACAWLPDHDLSDLARDYGLTNLQPICDNDPPLPDALPKPRL